MARFRKIDVRIWNDRKFRELSDNGKLAFILLLTHPNTTQIGTIRTRVSNLADELGWSNDAMSHAIREAILKGMIDADEKAGLMVINNFLRYNAPSSPNAFKSWRELIDLMPECDLLDKHVAGLKTFIDGLSDGMKKAIPNDLLQAIRDAMSHANEQPSRIQEQEKGEGEGEIYTTETEEKQPELANSFAGRVSEKASFSKTDPTEEELPLLNAEEENATEPTVSKTEKVRKSQKVKNESSALQKPDDVSGELWNDFLAHRKAIKKPFNQYALKLMQTECKKAGWTMTEAIERVLATGWISFKADFVKDEWKNPNAVWVTAAEYNKELPPVTYSIGAKDKFIEKLHAGMNAFDIKDLPNHKEQK